MARESGKGGTRSERVKGRTGAGVREGVNRREALKQACVKEGIMRSEAGK